MDCHPLPHTVDMIGVAARESVNRGAVGGIDDDNAAKGRFAVVSHEDVYSHDLDRMLLGLVKMDAVGAIILGARPENVFFVERVDDEQHDPSFRPGRTPTVELGRSTHFGRTAPWTL